MTFTDTHIRFVASTGALRIAYNQECMRTSVHTPKAGKPRAARTSEPNHGSRLSPLPGRILALDYGRRRIGLAVSDEMRITARPAGILERKNRRDMIRKLRDVAREYSARRIVVGHPLNLDGTAGEMAEEAARFASRLRKELGIEVDLMDERLTSWAAEQTLHETTRRAKRDDSGPRRQNDDIAAAILLRDYLERDRLERPAPRTGKE
ncbi:MAG: Holliday junction resolvase RuvX [Candidatus Acidiferrales bacterium]